MKWVVLVLLSLLACCSVTPHLQYSRVLSPQHYAVRHIPVFIDKTFSMEDKLHIDDSLSGWNYALNGYIEFVVKSTEFDMDVSSIKEAYENNGLLIMKVDSNCPFIPKSTLPGPTLHHTLAWADDIGGHKIYVIRDVLDAQDIFPIMLHEVGHILGAQHVPHKSLMYAEYHKELYSCIDEETVNQVGKYQHLELKYLNHCIND